ncbi:MAG: DUF2961 domain-containing protein [Oscillospiraceae bacterium]|nr:DUF2961 domain-containing protein [Oscillospiraceae bacterium]
MLHAGWQTRSISPENLTGKPGEGGAVPLDEGAAKWAARDLGAGWKVNPYRHVESGETLELANFTGPGEIRHIWLTPTGNWRGQIIRFYWDDCEQPSIECPLGDFFACGWGEYAPLSSLAVCVNPGSAFNCYWTMPFKKRCRVTLENLNAERVTIYYQITYILKPVDDNAGYFHARYGRANPLPYAQPYTILDGVEGAGQYVGTYMAWGVNNSGWWGEGEIKFFMDDDGEFPTICGTGTEDYFCGSYNFENQKTRQYEPFTTPYSGLAQVIKPDGVYKSQTRFGLYRWHIADPIVFHKKLKATIQALGWRSGGRYLPLRDDIASVAYWYQDKPAPAGSIALTADELEII